jgi:hypothetical protein
MPQQLAPPPAPVPMQQPAYIPSPPAAPHVAQPQRGGSKGIFIALVLLVMAGGVAFLFLDNGTKMPGDDGAPSGSSDTSASLALDGTQESALRLAAAMVLSGEDTPPESPWQELDIHITALAEDGLCHFAATMEQDGSRYLLGQFTANLTESGGKYTALNPRQAEQTQTCVAIAGRFRPGGCLWTVGRNYHRKGTFGSVSG